MLTRLSRTLCAAIVILAVLAGSVSAFAGSIAVRLNGAAKIYSSLSDSARTFKAPKGLEVTLKAYAKGWGKVSYKGVDGYVRLKYLDRVQPLKAYVTRAVGLYTGPSEGKKLANLTPGARVYVFGVDGKYVRVSSMSGKWKGYVKADALSSSRPAASVSKANAASGKPSAVPRKLRATAEGARTSKVERALLAAQNLIGVPYSERPTPPGSFDCAGYTAWCCQAAGLAMKDTTRSQGYDDRYSRIGDVGDLKRGDLVCFNTVEDEDYSDHVGLYLGDGYFLHCSSVARQVIVSQLNSGYYNRVFSWGKRLFG